MLGVELVKDRDTKEPASAECADALEMMKDMGVLIGKVCVSPICPGDRVICFCEGSSKCIHCCRGVVTDQFSE